MKDSTYINKPLKVKELIGKWKVEEVRVTKDSEEAEMQEAIGLMITFNFMTDKHMALVVMGMESVQKYHLDMNTNQLITINSKTEEETKSYIIKQLDKDYLIAYNKEHEMYFYLVKE